MPDPVKRLQQSASLASKMVVGLSMTACALGVGLVAAKWDEPSGTMHTMSLLSLSGLSLWSLLQGLMTSRQLRRAVEESRMSDGY